MHKYTNFIRMKLSHINLYLYGQLIYVGKAATEER